MSPLKKKYPERVIAIILCAGKGTRIKDTFPSTPKSLIKIPTLQDISILDHLISNLLDLDINKIEIIVGHLGFLIKEHIDNLKKGDKKVYHKVYVIDSRQEYQKGSFFSFLSFAKDLPKYSNRDLFLIFPGDTIFSKELLGYIFHRISKESTLFEKYPSIFYKDIKRKNLRAAYLPSVSTLKLYSKNEENYLKEIVHIDVKGKNGSRIKQIIPIVTFPYDVIRDIFKNIDEMNVNSIKDLINFLIKSKRQNFKVYKLSSKFQFYDIDSKYDLLNFERKSGQ
ncbi:MAG: sugar phosphate nucleotidyltransferase [Candidatus Lokiarchaeota archaeon]